MKLRMLVLSLVVLVLAGLVSTPASAQSCMAAWAPNTAYAVGAVVSYSGSNYRCIQGHTSLPGWEPPNVPALWTSQGTCSGSATPTTAPRATATTPPRATATATSRTRATAT